MSRAGGSRELNNQYTCFSRSLQRLSLIQAGAGIGLIPDFIHDQRGDTIVDVFPSDQFNVNTVYALHPFNQPPKAVKRVIEEIEAMFS